MFSFVSNDAEIPVAGSAFLFSVKIVIPHPVTHGVIDPAKKWQFMGLVEVILCNIKWKVVYGEIE